MKYYYDIIQRSPEWDALRLGIMTASESQAIGNQGKGLSSYIESVLQEKYEISKDKEYDNSNLEAGREREYQAKLLFELETGIWINDIGFILSDNELFGASPDGLIDYAGMAEIKCPSNKVYFKHLLDYSKGIDFIDSKYRWQIQGQLLAGKRHLCVFIMYNPNFKKKIIWQWVKEDFGMMRNIEEGIEIGSALIRKHEKHLAAL